MVTEINELVAVDVDETTRIKMRCAAIKQAAQKFAPQPGWSSEWPGLLNWRPNWGPTDGETSTWQPWDARKEDQPCCATGLVFGPRARFRPRRPKKEPDTGQQVPQQCPRKLKPIALAEVLMKLTVSCVIEQLMVEPTNMDGTWDARCFGCARARGSRLDRQDVQRYQVRAGRQMSSSSLAQRTPTAERTTHMLGGRATGLPSACSGVCGAVGTLWHHNMAEVGRRKGSEQHDQSGWQGSRVMQVMIVLVLEHALRQTRGRLAHWTKR